MEVELVACSIIDTYKFDAKKTYKFDFGLKLLSLRTKQILKM